MKIEFTNEEYRKLLDILYIAEWVLTAHEEEEDPGSEQYLRLIEKLYSRAQEAGHGRLITRDAKKGEYYPSREFDDTTPARDYIEDFVDHSFWDELMYRLAERDAARQAGGYEQLQALSRKQRNALLDPLDEKYGEEFTKHGLDHVAIVEHFDFTGGTPVKTHD